MKTAPFASQILLASKIESYTIGTGWTTATVQAFVQAVHRVVRDNPLLTSRVTRSAWNGGLYALPHTFPLDAHDFVTVTDFSQPNHNNNTTASNNDTASVPPPPLPISSSTTGGTPNQQDYQRQIDWLHTHIAPLITTQAFLIVEIVRRLPLFDANLFLFPNGVVVYHVNLSHSLGDATTYYMLMQQISQQMNQCYNNNDNNNNDVSNPAATVGSPTTAAAVDAAAAPPGHDPRVPEPTPIPQNNASETTPSQLPPPTSSTKTTSSSSISSSSSIVWNNPHISTHQATPRHYSRRDTARSSGLSFYMGLFRRGPQLKIRAACGLHHCILSRAKIATQKEVLLEPVDGPPTQKQNPATAKPTADENKKREQCNFLSSHDVVAAAIAQHSNIALDIAIFIDMRPRCPELFAPNDGGNCISQFSMPCPDARNPNAIRRAVTQGYYYPTHQVPSRPARSGRQLWITTWASNACYLTGCNGTLQTVSHFPTLGMFKLFPIDMAIVWSVNDTCLGVVHNFMDKDVSTDPTQLLHKILLEDEEEENLLNSTDTNQEGTSLK